MHHGHNYGYIFLDAIIDSKRKLANQGAPSVAVNRRIQVWLARDYPESLKKLIQKMLPKARPLAFVPLGCLFDVGLGVAT